MEKIFKKIFITLTATAGILVAFSPLTSYAAMQKHDGSLVSLNVMPTLSLTVAPATLNVNVTPGSVGSNTFTATVDSPQHYALAVSGKDGDIYMTHTSNSSLKIPGNETVAAGNTAWGVRLSGTSTYSNILASPTAAAELYKSTTDPSAPTLPISNKVTTFEVGVAAGPSLASGTYIGNLVVTAHNV